MSEDTEFETMLNTKKQMSRFIEVLMKNELELENKVISEEAEGVLDCLMIKYSGRLSIDDLKVLQAAFDGENVEVGNEYVCVYLPESLYEVKDW